jgi:hypothetical protein
MSTKPATVDSFEKEEVLEHPNPTVFGVLKNNPKTVTGFVASVISIGAYLGVDTSLISKRNGAEFWRQENGSYVAIEPSEIKQGEIILRIDWTGQQREIKDLQIYKVNNEVTPLVKTQTLSKTTSAVAMTPSDVEKKPVTGNSSKKTEETEPKSPF